MVWTEAWLWPECGNPFIWNIASVQLVVAQLRMNGHHLVLWPHWVGQYWLYHVLSLVTTVPYDTVSCVHPLCIIVITTLFIISHCHITMIRAHQQWNKIFVTRSGGLLMIFVIRFYPLSWVETRNNWVAAWRADMWKIFFWLEKMFSSLFQALIYKRKRDLWENGKRQKNFPSCLFWDAELY